MTSPYHRRGGATSTSCSHNFFCNLQWKVTLQTVRLLWTQKFLKIPQLLGLCPRPHCTSFSKNTYCIKLYFEFDCLNCFSPIFASPTEKSFNFWSPNWKIVPVPMAPTFGHWRQAWSAHTQICPCSHSLKGSREWVPTQLTWLSTRIKELTVFSSQGLDTLVNTPKKPFGFYWVNPP